VGGISCRLLIDSGAGINVLSGEIFRRLRKTLYTVRPKTRYATLSSANQTQMTVLCDIDVDIRIGGLNLPCTFAVIENLGFQAVLGMEFLQDAKAIIDIANHSLALYDGLTTVPLVRADENVCIVKTVDRKTIPPRAEAVFNASMDTHSANGIFMIQPSIWAKCQQLLPAHTIFDAKKRVFCCRVLNATDKKICLSPRTIVAAAAPVNIIKSEQTPQIEDTSNTTLTVAEMRSELEQKGVGFSDCVFTGADLDALIKMLYNYRDRIAVKLTDLEECNVLQCEIDTGDALPIRSRCFRYSPEQKKILKQQVQELLDADIIEPSDSPWSSQVLLVAKKDTNELRFAIDYRNLNKVSRLTSYPVPTMDSIFDSLAASQASFFSNIDLRSGFFQTAMAPGSRDKTAFSVEGLGNFALKRLGQGLLVSPGFLQRVMDTVLKSLIPKMVLVYLDDVLVYSRNPQEMVDRLALVFDRFRAAKLKIHPKKSHFGVGIVCFLGHEFTKEGVSPDPRKFDIVRKFPVPRNQKQIKLFLGLTNFYRKSISGYSLISRPLRELLKNDRKFLWTKECEESIQEYKEKLITAPVLMLPKLDQAYFVSTDASRSGIAWTIQQKDEQGRLRPVLFGGRALKDSEKNGTMSMI
jgi:hypothetical protein